MAITVRNRAFLQRLPSTDQGTFGIFSIGDFRCFTLELPDRDNAPQVSRILPYDYLVTWRKSTKFGLCYHVEGTVRRSGILIHPGTFAGDVLKGYKSHSHGCILPCMKIGSLDGQKAGLISRVAVSKITSILQQQPFILEIRND